MGRGRTRAGALGAVLLLPLVAAADGLLAKARVVGGSARVERSSISGLEFGSSDPPGAFLMRRLKDAFDPRGILEPARSVAG